MRSHFLSLKTFISLHEAALLLLVIVVGLISGIFAYYWQQNSAEDVRINKMAVLAEQVRADVYAQIQEMLRARVLEDVRAPAIFDSYSRSIDDNFNLLRQYAVSSEEIETVQQLQVKYREIQYEMNRFTGGSYSEPLKYIRISDHTIASRMVSDFEYEYALFHEELKRQQQEFNNQLIFWSNKLPVIIPILVVLTCCVVIYTRYSFNRGFVRPVSMVIAGAKKMSQGDLMARIDENGVAEVSDLAKTLNQMAADLKESNDALVESERQAALGELVPVVAHNIRNPLASIRATAQLIDSDDPVEELHEARDRIINTTDRLGRWVSALVSYLHPLNPEFQQIYASELLLVAVDLLDGRLQEKKMQVKRNGWQHDIKLKVDPDLMEQALYAVMANAIDASPQGSVLELKMSTYQGHLLLHIIDVGSGIPFVPVSGHLEPGPSTKRFGTGLGIPIALKICQVHGWSVQFNTPGSGGTEVVITAPA